MVNWSDCSEVERHPNKVSGVWVFRDTRLPVTTFFQVLNDGASIDDFLEWYPGVRRQQLEVVLAFASSGLSDCAA